MNSSYFPKLREPWQLCCEPDDPAPREGETARTAPGALEEYCGSREWELPEEAVCFICDPHADTEAFVRSLEAARMVHRAGPTDADLELTTLGRSAELLIGGDCLDKGPSNLRLLDSIAWLRSSGARVRLLVGNHDLRTLMGLSGLGRKDPLGRHLFARLGKKAAALLLETWQWARRHGHAGADQPSEAAARAYLFPDPAWYSAFPRAARGQFTEAQTAAEVRRAFDGARDLEGLWRRKGLTLGQLVIAAEQARALMLEPGGPYAWFFHDMELLVRRGSFLFVHAGIDDTLAQTVAQDGTAVVNARYRQQLRGDLLDLYTGPLGNAVRTKYRAGDHPLTDEGTRHLHACGLHAIVHGHRNLLRGQRLVLRRGLLNFECDASMDGHTRAQEGLEGPGGAAVVFHPHDGIQALSTDYPFVKSLELRSLSPSQAGRRRAAPAQAGPTPRSARGMSGEGGAHAAA